MSLDQAKQCEWCGHYHGDLCPHIKAMDFEYLEDGTKRVKRVEFLTPNDRPKPEEAK